VTTQTEMDLVESRWIWSKAEFLCNQVLDALHSYTLAIAALENVVYPSTPLPPSAASFPLIVCRSKGNGLCDKTKICVWVFGGGGVIFICVDQDENVDKIE